MESEMTKHIEKVFKKNLEINGKAKLMKWLYGECLELSAALVAYELQPTEQHLKELHEEIADVKVLLTQYFIFHNIESANVKYDIPVNDNLQMAHLFAANGYYLSFELNYHSAQIVFNALMRLCHKKYSLQKIMSNYHFKINKLDARLEKGEFECEKKEK